MINENIYRIDYTRFKEQLLPILLRKPKLLAFLKQLITPFISLYDLFFEFKNQAIYKTQHNASIILLTKVLNDAFDPVDRRIYIENALILDSEHFYTPENGPPFYFYYTVNGPPQYYMEPGAYNVYGSDFTVFIPQLQLSGFLQDALRKIAEIKAKLDYYKLFGTKYTIVWLS